MHAYDKRLCVILHLLILFLLLVFSLLSLNNNSLISYFFITTRDCIDIIKERNTTCIKEYYSETYISNDMIPGDVANLPIPEEYRYKRLLIVWLLVEPDQIKIITR